MSKSGQKIHLRYWESNPGLFGTQKLRANDVSHYTIPDVVIVKRLTLINHYKVKAASAFPGMPFSGELLI